MFVNNLGEDARNRTMHVDPGLRHTYLLGVLEESVGVAGVGAAKHERGRRHCCSGLPGEFGPGVLGVKAVGLTARRHVLRPHPAIVVRVTIADLHACDRIDRTLQ